MILIHEERQKRVLDLKIVQSQIRKVIKDYRKEIDDEPAEDRMNLDENLDLITFHESELQYLKAMQKVPFDVLVVIQQEGEL